MDNAASARLSLWDELLVPFSAFGSDFQGLTVEADGRRRRVRTGPYDELLRLQRSGSADPQSVKQAIDSLRDDFTRRAEQWSNLARRVLRDEDLARFHRMLVDNQFHGIAGLWMLFAVPIVWCRRILGLSRTMKLTAALAQGCCPDCRYPLRELPDPFGELSAGGPKISPAACPECGSPWPLLPPPVAE
ncbi:MAG: hypothetical protein IT436_09400 [Phycisphaerales bacterium]|nr:hypothetical protein [Phycisphaerales bacterium]